MAEEQKTERPTCGCKMMERMVPDPIKTGFLLFEPFPFCPLHAKAPELKDMVKKLVEAKVHEIDNILSEAYTLLKEIDNG